MAMADGEKPDAVLAGEIARVLSPATLASLVVHEAGLRLGTLRPALPEPLPMPPPPRLPPVRLAALLACADATFLDEAYGAILGRAPDPAGRAFHAAALAADPGARIAVIGALRRSAEGRAVATRIPGLRRALVLHRLRCRRGRA